MSSVQAPNQFLILNDKVLISSEVHSVSSISNLNLELGVANENNNGNLSLFCIDNNPTVQKNFEFRLQNSGSLYKADFIWRDSSTNVWYGEQDKRYLSSPQNTGITDIAYNATGVYSTKLGLLFNFYGKSANTIGISYTHVSMANQYDGWTTTEFDFTTTSAGLGASGLTDQTGVLDVVELSNQKLLMVVKYERDLYLYISEDGFTWELYSPRLLARFTNITQDIYNVKMACSGNYVRIIGVKIPTAPLSALGDEPYEMFSIVSADRGSSWTKNSFSKTAFQKESSGADRFSFDIENFDDNGTFIITVLGDEDRFTTTTTEVTGELESVELVNEDEDEEPTFSWRNVTEILSENTYNRVNTNAYETYIASSINEPSQIPRLTLSPGLEPQNIYLCNHADFIVAMTVSISSRNDLVEDFEEEFTNSMTGQTSSLILFQNYEYQIFLIRKNENPLDTNWISLNGGYNITGFFGAARFIPAKGKLYSSTDSMHWFHAIRDRNIPLHYGYRSGAAYTNIGAWVTRPLKDNNFDNFTGSQSLSNFKTNKHQPTGRLFIPQWNCLIGVPGVGTNGSRDTVWGTDRSGAVLASWSTDRMELRGLSNATSSDKLFYRYVDPTVRVVGTGALAVATARNSVGMSDFGTGTFLEAVSPRRNWCFIPEVSGSPEVDLFNNSPHGACIIWEASFDEGSNPIGTGTTNDNMVVGLSSYSLVNSVMHRVNCTVRHSETSIVLFDNIANAPLATITPDVGIYGSNTFKNYWEYRWAWYPYVDRVQGSTTQCILTCRQIGTQNAWLSTGMVSPTLSTSGVDIFNQMLYFGNMVSCPNQKSKWKKVEVHPYNDLGVFALEQSNLVPIRDINALDAIRGRNISDAPTIFDTSQQNMAVWGGASGHYNDRFTADMTFDYPPSNICSQQSPRVHYRTKSIATSNISSTLNSTIVLKSNDDELFYHDGIAVINTNIKQIDVSYSMDGLSYGASRTLNTERVSIGRIQSINDNIFEINFTDTNNIFNGEINSNTGKKYYLRITTSASTIYNNFAYLIDRSYGQNIFALDPSVMNAGSTQSGFHSSLVGSTVAIYNDRAYNKYDSSLFGKYIKITLNEINFTAERYGYIGSIIAGKRFNFDVPLNWSYTDNETANQQRFKTRSGISWSYNQGPAERQLDLTMIGDVTERSRRELRERLKTTNGYGDSNLVFITESTGADREMIFHGYPSNATNFKNDGWYYDENAQKWFSVGDLQLTFIEIT